jgi:hypothetical protein
VIAAAVILIAGAPPLSIALNVNLLTTVLAVAAQGSRPATRRSAQTRTSAPVSRSAGALDRAGYTETN